MHTQCTFCEVGCEFLCDCYIDKCQTSRGQWYNCRCCCVNLSVKVVHFVGGDLCVFVWSSAFHLFWEWTELCWPMCSCLTALWYISDAASGWDPFRNWIWLHVCAFNRPHPTFRFFVVRVWISFLWRFHCRLYEYVPYLSTVADNE
jgi:hypothetical protein